jgi:8-oxo-dGTP pyrophosphatase MutT (NUDIX family)
VKSPAHHSSRAKPTNPIRKPSSSKAVRQVAVLPWRVDRDGKLCVLLITSRTNQKWMLPKGWPMDGKSEPEAALIEAREEAGVEGEIKRKPVGAYHYLKILDEKHSAPARAIIYPMRVDIERAEWLERDERQRKWLRPHKAARMVFEPDLSRFLTDVARRRVLIG